MCRYLAAAFVLISIPAAVHAGKSPQAIPDWLPVDAIESASIHALPGSSLPERDEFQICEVHELFASEPPPSGIRLISYQQSRTSPPPRSSVHGAALQERWRPFLEFRFFPGNHQSFGDGGLFLPLAQDREALLYADISGQLDDHDHTAGRWGLGLRNLTKQQVNGIYAFYERRWTDHSNAFNQLIVGAEMMARDWDVRVNGYLPDSRPQAVGGPTPGFETAYHGVEAELGVLLHAWGPNDRAEWRAWAGGFWFDTSQSLPEIAGPRVRTELRLFDVSILGRQSRIVLGADYQWDQVRRDTVFCNLQIRIPLGCRPQCLCPLERRILDRPRFSLPIGVRQPGGGGGVPGL